MPKVKIIPLLLAVAFVSGCGDERQAARRNPAFAPEPITKEEFLQAVADAERDAANSTPPKAVITLPDLDGWARSEPRPLPSADHGFTVAYNHRSGLAVTLYQYTRGLPRISDDLNSDPVQEEMRRARMGIEQAVQMGLWRAAKETDNGVVALGDSAKQALWSRYTLNVEGDTVTSDTYIWSHANTLFKLRCTGQSENSEAETKVLAELLQALGSACVPEAKR